MVDVVVSELAAWRNSKEKIKCNVVLTGQSRSGKSALVRALFGDEEVSKEQDKPENKARKGEKHVLNYQGNSITLWDTCGFFEKKDPRTDEAFDALKIIPCLKKEGTYTLIYTISKTKACFEPSNDIEGMMRFMDTFGPQIWKNAIIVLKTTSVQEAEENEKCGTKDWVVSIRKHLGKDIMPNSQAQKIPIVSVGYLNTEDEAATLESESLVLKVWQHIALVAPLEHKPFLLDVCINKLFAANALFSDSYLSLIKFSSKFYQQKVVEIKKKMKTTVRLV